MGKSVKKAPVSDIDGDFINDINLHRLVTPVNAVEQLKTIANYYLSGRSIEVPSPILLVGKTSYTIARAFANTIAHIPFYETYSSSFNMGGECFESFFEQEGQFATYYLHRVEELSAYSTNLLSKMIRNKEVIIPKIVGYREEKRMVFNKLLIMSSMDNKLVKSEILDQVKVQITIKGYSPKQIENILRQRLVYLGLRVEEEKSLKDISQSVNSNIGLAIQVLERALRCSVAGGAEDGIIRNLSGGVLLFHPASMIFTYISKEWTNPFPLVMPLRLLEED